MIGLDHPDYPSHSSICNIPRVELASLFCEKAMVWEDTLNFFITEFAKGLRILNMVMTIVLTPRSHYNTITEPRAHFLLSLQEDLFIDFPSHMIVSMIDIFETLLQVISSSFLQLSHAFSHTCMSPFLLLLSFTP